jgi:imidazolonepropionase-like amidohydrolase
VRFSAALLLATAASCSATTAATDAIIVGDPSSTSIAIVGVNVIPMDRDNIIESQTVLVDNGRITQIGPSSSVPVPSGALKIEAKGKYLMPGLIDMHVHTGTATIDKYLPNGVTSVRNMWGYEELVPLIQDIDAGKRIGPRIFSLSAGFDGSPAQWPYTQISDDPAQVRALINHQYDLGFREIKVYQRLSRAAYDTIVKVAREKGMTFAGHMPPNVGLQHVLESGQRSIEHLGGYGGSNADIQSEVAMTVKAGTYNCPTLAIQKMLRPSSAFQPLLVVTRELNKAGAKLLVGTDSGIDVTEPGKSIHDELSLFVSAGVSPFDALSGATRVAAEYLGQSSSIGTVEVGKEADLLLLNGNPLKDISATKKIAAVIVNGRLVK